MTDISFAAAPRGPADAPPAATFTPVSIVAIAGGLWAAATATLLWTGLPWGWALGLGYAASPVMTVAVLLLACAAADLGAGRAAAARAPKPRRARRA